MEIRFAKKDDLKAMAEIYMAEMNKPPFSAGYVEKTAMQKIAMAFEDKDAKCFVAVIDKKIVGFAVLKKSFWANGWEGLLDKLFVAKEHQQKGIGKKLLEIVEDSCKDQKLSALDVITKKDAASMEFYEALGFKPTGYVGLEKKFGNPKDSTGH